jgi:hypothetical protein
MLSLNFLSSNYLCEIASVSPIHRPPKNGFFLAVEEDCFDILTFCCVSPPLLELKLILLDFELFAS